MTKKEGKAPTGTNDVNLGWKDLDQWDATTVLIDDELNEALEAKGIKSSVYAYGSRTKNPVLLVYPNWVASKNATITAENFSLKGFGEQGAEGAALQMFSQPIQGKNTETTSGNTDGTTADDILGRTGWDPENVTTYYARTLPEQSSAELVFDTYEPGSRVTVTLEFGGRTVYQETVSDVKEPDGEVTTDGEAPVATLVKALRNGPSTVRNPNSREKPARAIWTLNIPLAYSDGAAGADSIYNVVTVKVESPDAVENGETADNTKTYTFNIQRLRDPKLEQETGNTKAGLEQTTWSTLPGVYRYKGVYGAGAWPDANDDPDRDEYAVAAYLNNAVELPGLTLIDSEGFRTELGKGTAGGTATVKYKLQVNGVRDGKLTTDVFTSADKRTLLYYLGSEFISSEAPGTLGNEKLTLDLKSTVVCPGRYSIQYEFTDPVAGKTYDSNSDKYFETDNAATFTRTLLILAIPGDVDMDGAVTTADAIALRKAIADENSFAHKGSNVYKDASLFTYRVCDVNGDGQVDAADVDELYQGFAPELRNYFYTPWNWRVLAADVAQANRETADGSDSTKAHLEVEYLEIEVPTEGVENQEGVELGNVFWTGVKLSGLENLTETTLSDKVKALTISLSYNSTYLKPALREADSQAKKVYTYAEANAGTWGSDYDYSHSIWNQEAKPHSSKAETELTGKGGAFREIQVIVELKDGAAGKTLQELTDGYILKLPFELIAHPDVEDPKLLEATLGMRELNLITQKNGTTAAFTWSMTGDIYGGATKNLADYVDHCGADPIPFGEDRTPFTTIEAVYGVDFSYYIGSSESVSEYLPAGLTHSVDAANMGSVIGVPQEVGTFEFYYHGSDTNRTRYSLVVKKAPLTVWVDDQDKYYGENNPALTFSYDVSQVKAVDQIADPDFFPVHSQGDGAALEKLAGYTAPKVTTETTNTSDAGDYEILLDGAKMTSDHYEFHFVDGKPDDGAEGQSGDGGAVKESRGTLTVHKRPLWLQKITRTSVGSLFSEDMVLRLSARALADGYYRQDDFTMGTPELTDGKYKGLPLTADKTLLSGDDLHITFDALFKADNEQYPYFEMNGAGQKFCDVTIDTVKLDETYGAARNYELLTKAATTSTPATDRGGSPVDDQAQGTVMARKVVGIRLIGELDSAEYTHGDGLNLSGLAVSITYEKMGEGDADTEVENLTWNGDRLFEENGLSVHWAEPDGKGGYTVGERAGHNQELSRYVHNGLVLCVEADTFESDGSGGMVGKKLYTYTTVPLTVNKRELTLYLAKQDRYYGENNADFVVTYDIEQLAPEDREDRTGSITDFETAPLAGYTAPTITVLDSRGRPVDRTTGVGSYTVTIRGAVSSDYNIRYAPAEDGNAEPQTTATNLLTIYPRPIIITKVSAQAPFIYADTGTVTGTGATTIDNVKLQYNSGKQEFTVTRPQEGDGYYYQVGRVEDRYETAQGTAAMPLTGDAVLDGDTLELSYRAEYVRDNNTEGDPYFVLDPGNAQEARDVLVKDIVLLSTGSAKNYTLVFTRNDNASGGLPGSSGAVDGEERKTTGEVRWRAIQKLEITSIPRKLEYTYGEVLELSGLAVRITSENDGVGGGTPLVRDIEYRTVIAGDTQTNTFAQAGLWVSWDSSDGDPAQGGEYVTVAERNGATLVVSARRQSSHKLLTANVRQPVTVHKKSLPLTVQPQYKFYGESNRDYSFSFELSDLAVPDREKVAGMSLTGSAAYDEFDHPDGNDHAYSLTGEQLAAELAGRHAVSAALSKINEAYESATPYEGPVFSSGCTAHSDVTGTYPLTLSGGAMANYEFTYIASTTTVFRRPIQIEEITKYPVYKPFVGTEAGKTYTTECLIAPANGEDAARQEFSMAPLNTTTGSGMTNPYDSAYVQQMGSARLPRNAVDVLPGDTAGLQIRLTLTDTGNCIFDVSGMQLTSGSANYCLYYRNSDKANKREPDITTARGAFETRNITSVEIVSEPRFNYTYNQLGQGQNLGELDLSRLRIKITYQGEEGESPNEIVTASEKEGVYISYWPADRTVSSDPGTWQTITQTYRPAATGDHLTIAKDETGFAHNGMKLIISARASEDLPFVTPVVTTGTIKVSPLELTYSLSAADKVYDGSKRATGTITLRNVYAGDEVYIDTGVTYADFADYVSKNGYSFTSAADSAGTALRFDFKDPNVAYETAPTHDNYGALDTKVVEVRGIALKGKDAENYRINDAVTETTQQIPGRDGAPRATITKARRTLDELTILMTTDMNTNTVEVSVAEDVLTKGDRNDAHNSKPELHYEYALEYLDPAGSMSTVVLPWQDGRFFGGEAVAVENDGTAEPPAGSGAGQEVNGADTDFGKREPLPRDTYFRALVRVAETHNYEASNFVVSVEDLAAAVAAAEAVQPPEPDDSVKAPQPMEPSPLGKTYRYRLDLVSTYEVKSAQGGETQRFKALEGVWFNDIEEYKDSKALDRAVDNMETVRYHGFYEDEEQKKTVGFPLTMEEALRPQEPGGTTEEPLPENTLRLYVSLQAQSPNVAIRSIKLSAEEVRVTLGDAPMQLTVEYTPKSATTKRVTWSSSNENVVTVDKDGVLTFVGIGEAVVTAATRNGKTASVTVKVQPPVDSPFDDTLFNVNYTGTYFELDSEYNFRPEDRMTRGEAAEILARFLAPAEDGELARAEAFVDVDSTKSYADAVALMRVRGIIQGVGGNCFDGERYVTREEVAAMLGRMLLLGRGTEAGRVHAFVDCTEETNWGYAYVDDLAYAGIAQGGSGACFYPDEAATRAELATFIARILVTEAQEDGPTLLIPADMTAEHWAYGSVLRAVNTDIQLKVAE